MLPPNKAQLFPAVKRLTTEEEMVARNARRELLMRTKGKWAGHAGLVRLPTPPTPLLITESAQWQLNLLVPIPSVGTPSSFAHAASAYESLKKSHKGLAAAGLGTLRLNGWGLPQDHALALSLFTEAAGLAHARGETGLGIMYSRGLAVELDYVIAFRMLHMGAAQGDTTAMYELGRLHWFQKGCMLDMPAGERWFRLAAEGGHAEAQFMLGQMYQFGTAAHARHLETAAAYFTGAAQQGHELAIEGAKWVKDRLWTPDLLEKLNRARDARRSMEDKFAAQAQLTRDEEERTLKAATRAEKLENTLLAKLAKNKARKADIDTAQQLFERESERAVIAEGELATQQGALVLQENNLKEALRTVGLLEARIEELMNELVKRQHRHSDVQGVWESSWVARDWEGSGPMKLWKPVAGVRDARFVSRWSCCQCANPHSHFCRPVCGCEDFVSDRFCKGMPWKK